MKMKYQADEPRYYLSPAGQEFTGDERVENGLSDYAKLCLYCGAVDCYI